MRTGLTVSAIGHLAFVAWGLVTFSSFEPLDASDIEAVPFEFIAIDDISQIPIGVPTAEEPLAPLPPEPPPEPEPVEEPPPEPEPLPPEPEPELQEPESPEPEPPPEPVDSPADEAPPEPEPDLSPEPEPELQLEEPTQEQAATPPPLPRVRPDRPPPDEQFTDNIAALLDSDAPTEADPSVGGVTGSPSTKLRQNQIDALLARLAGCWEIPPTRPDPAQLRVKIKMFLNPNGTLARPSAVVEYRPTQIGQVAAEAAVRAVERCAPYNLPVASYDSWREIIVTFDPRDMFGG